MNVTIAIPTYNRGPVLVESLPKLFRLEPAPLEILVLDQTRDPSPYVADQLERWEKDGKIRWIRLPEPSIPGSMNHALTTAIGDVVLFLDDDSEPAVDDLAEEHVRAYSDPSVGAVVGQVLQPGELPVDVGTEGGRNRIADLDFPFYSTRPSDVTNVIACNLSVRRSSALALGGFDLNFTGTAYRFETDFAWRVWDAGLVVRFEPRAAVRHLKARVGGTRTWGDHLRSAAPAHSIGDYYLALTHFGTKGAFPYIARRMRRSILTRFDLTHPWWIPVKIIRELRALRQAAHSRRRGRQLMLS